VEAGDRWQLSGDAVVAPVVLGPDSSDCTVVGAPNLRTALDLGTDNILVGVEDQGQLLGPALQAAMEEKRRLLEALQH